MKITQLASYVAHSQIITQLLVLDHPKHPLLASSSMDGFVHLFYLYGMKENQYQSSRPPLVSFSSCPSSLSVLEGYCRPWGLRLFDVFLLSLSLSLSLYLSSSFLPARWHITF
jgi:hypothetical protein